MVAARPHPEPPATGRRSRWAQSAFVGAACLGLGLAATLDFARWRSGHRLAERLVADYGLAARHPGIERQVGRRYDPLQARLRVALTLLDEELDRGWLAELAAAEQRRELDRGPGRLRLAGQIARQTWPRRPASWRAALIAGGTTYLELARTGDPRLLAEAPLWEAPLLAARSLAPAQTAPVRFLAAAYLGNWSSLSPERRTAAVELLRDAFRERSTLRLLVAEWLRVAPSLGQALAVIPAEPWAWQELEQTFARRGDWERAAEARRRGYQALAASVETALAAADRQLAGGEPRRARTLLLSLSRQLPVDRGFAPAMQRLLERLPPGPVAEPFRETFADWLDWSLDRCLFGTCPLSPAAIDRLAYLAGPLQPARAALAALAAGDLARAELTERRGATSTDDWAPYRLLKAEALAARGEVDNAARTLADVPAHWRSTPRFWLARRRLAELAGDLEAAAAVDRELARLRRSAWSEPDWRWREDGVRLELLPEGPSAGLEIEVREAPPAGAVVEILWDGALIEVLAVRAGERIAVAQTVSPDLHLLELIAPRGPSVRPGRVTLR